MNEISNEIKMSRVLRHYYKSSSENNDLGADGAIYLLRYSKFDRQRFNEFFNDVDDCLNIRIFTCKELLVIIRHIYFTLKIADNIIPKMQRDVKLEVERMEIYSKIDHRSCSFG